VRSLRFTRSTSSVASVASVASTAASSAGSIVSAASMSTLESAASTSSISSSAAAAPASDAIAVAVRVRPLNAKELANQSTEVVRVLDEHVIAFDPLDAFGRDTRYQPGVPTHRNRRAKVPLDAGRPPAALPGMTDMGLARGSPSYAGPCAQDLKFAFDRVFDVDAKQSEVYQGTTQPLIDFVLDGYNATVFAYGVRGPGRTHDRRIGGAR